MNLTRFVSLIACLAASSLLFGQTVSISDDSPGSPVSLTGTVTFGSRPEDVTCSISGRNQSSNPIITTALELKLTAPSGQPGEFRFNEDHFFSESLVTPSQANFPVVKNMVSDCRMVRELDLERTPAAPEAHTRVLFVQFLDGSVWTNGKLGSDTGADLMAQRAAVLTFLQSLKDAYSSNGLAGLQQALAVDQTPGTMVSNKQSGLRMVNDTSGMQAVADLIQKNLATAEARKAALVTEIKAPAATH
jgi:hypothetical protein